MSLFTPLTIKSVTFKNRITVSPMCLYSSKDGFATNWHLVHLGSRAVGGAGSIIVEATAVSPEARISLADLGIWKDDHIEKLKEIVDFIHENGCVAGIQLAHSGRKGSHSEPWKGRYFLDKSMGGWRALAPSPIPLTEGEQPPLELTKEGINKIINDFRNAAVRALKAGFKLIEVHAAHGYLLNEFLSPLTNLRKDEYGGSLRNRSRLLLEIVHAIKEVWPDDLPLFVRISVTEWTEGGWTVEDSVKLCRALKNAGVDLIDCSSGGNVPQQEVNDEPGYQVPFADIIKKECNILTGAVGLITTAEQAEEIIVDGNADLVFMAREFLRDPYFPIHAAEKLNVDLKWPDQYERAKNYLEKKYV